MSKSFTARPTVTRGRGRGTQTNQGTRGGIATGTRGGAVTRGNHSVNRPPPAVGRGTGMDTTRSSGYGTGAVPRSTQPGVSNAEAEQRMTHQGAYTMITPNERRRQQITEAADRETQAYEQYRQQKKPVSLNIVGTVGGGQVTQAAARQKMAASSPNKTQKLLQQQQRKSLLRQKEEEEIQMKKNEQRAKAIMNEQRQRDGELADAARWDDQKRRTNEAWLNRLEKQNKRSTNASGTQASSSSMHVQTASPYAVPMATTETRSSNMYSTGGSPEVGMSDEHTRRIDALSAMFPQYSRDELRSILEQVDFSLDAAVSLLQ